MKQESFNAHFAEADHNGEEDWEVKLIDQTDNVEDLRKMSGKWPYFDIYLTSLFVILTHNIYCNKWQWHVPLYV